MTNSAEMSQKEEVKNVVYDNSTAKKINKLLNSSETRIEALHLLNLFLPQCPDEEFLQFCISWMQNCCKTDASTKNKDYAIHLLSTLFKISSHHQELKKSVSFFITTRYFDYFFKHLLNSQAGWCCTESCLLYYRGACGVFQAPLEKHLKNELEKNAKISSTIGGCYALMPCIGGGGNDGVNYIKNWKIQFVNFLNACHSILNELFGSLEEFQEFETPTDFKNNIKNKTPKDLIIRLTNYSIVLKCMLLNQYPAPKIVPSDLVFQLVCRGLSLNLKALTKQKSPGVVSLEKILPEVQYELLSLLKALIITCKNQLLPYSNLICKLIKQMLEWTDGDFICGSNSPLELLRILSYEVLCDWLTVARSGSCVEVISGVVLNNGINDIISKKKVVLLKEKKPEKRLKGGKEQTNRQTHGADNARLCLTALKTFQFLLKFTGVLLKPDEHRLLQETVVKLIMDVQKNSSPDLPVPFDIPACRTDLYSLLLELVCQPCSKWPPPSNYALRLFREGMNDPCTAVSSVCSAALNFATIIIHPQYDNGGFPHNDMSPDDGRRTEVELQWTEREEPMEVDNEKDGDTSPVTENTETIPEENEKDKPGTPIDMSESSVIPSDEDSRSTGKYEPDSAKPEERNPETNTPSAETGQINDEPSTKKQKMQTGEKTPSPVKESSSVKHTPENSVRKTTEKTPSPVKENQNENVSVKDIPDNSKRKQTPEKTPSPVKEIQNDGDAPTKDDPESSKKKKAADKTPSPAKESSGSGTESTDTEKRKKVSEKRKSESKSDSPESMNEESQQNRYYLRSKLENTPSGHRPRTRALSRGQINSEIKPKPAKNRKDDDDDEEDIKASFDDSFVD